MYLNQYLVFVSESNYPLTKQLNFREKIQSVVCMVGRSNCRLLADRGHRLNQQVSTMGACTNHVDKRGEGVAQMTTIHNNCYLVKVSTYERKGVKIAQNSVTMVCTRPYSNCMSRMSRKIKSTHIFQIREGGLELSNARTFTQ